MVIAVAIAVFFFVKDLLLWLLSSLFLLFLPFLIKAGEEDREEEVPYQCGKSCQRREKEKIKEGGGEDQRGKKNGNKKEKVMINNGQEEGKTREQCKRFLFFIRLSLAYSQRRRLS